MGERANASSENTDNSNKTRKACTTGKSNKQHETRTTRRNQQKHEVPNTKRDNTTYLVPPKAQTPPYCDSSFTSQSCVRWLAFTQLPLKTTTFILGSQYSTSCHVSSTRAHNRQTIIFLMFVICSWNYSTSLISCARGASNMIESTRPLSPRHWMFWPLPSRNKRVDAVLGEAMWNRRAKRKEQKIKRVE